MIGQGLTLVTGATGSGKTAWVVAELAGQTERPVFVMGIPELTLPHEPCPPVAEWVRFEPDPDDPALRMPYFTFPAGSIVVLDEAQRVFRPRASGAKVPPEVAAFETRRHVGVDFVMVTQHPTLLDANVRKLVNRHIHIHSTFAGRFALEWVGLGEPDERGSRELAARTRYKPAKKVFGLYKSAEVHTKVARRLPWQMFALALLLPALLAGGWYAYGRVAAKGQPIASETAGKTTKTAEGVRGGERSEERPVVTTAAYVDSYRPRVEGLVHTAPVYDGLTKPVDVPVPVGCIKSEKRCQCYDQRGNPYDTTADICGQLVKRYMFVDFVRPERDRAEAGGRVATDRQPSGVEVTRPPGLSSGKPS